ncbi:type II toxin-antitoxin system VapC family toxin [Ekhidna sp.]|uniref:type II toxin-antitoxin system VapC family toxin n=1 Tax=Ekhidna sp. TaxID=2608089 RepID=UPI003CCBEC8B
MRNTLIDAGPIIALFDRSDQYHLKAVRFLEGYEGFLWTTWPVLTEALHMLDFNSKAQQALLEWVDRGGLRIYDLPENQIGRIKQLTLKFNDVPMDLADATLVVVSELSGYREIISIDSDFYIYWDIRNKYLTNIFE